MLACRHHLLCSQCKPQPTFSSQQSRPDVSGTAVSKRSQKGRSRPLLRLSKQQRLQRNYETADSGVMSRVWVQVSNLHSATYHTAIGEQVSCQIFRCPAGSTQPRLATTTSQQVAHHVLQLAGRPTGMLRAGCAYAGLDPAWRSLCVWPGPGACKRAVLRHTPIAAGLGV